MAVPQFDKIPSEGSAKPADEITFGGFQIVEVKNIDGSFKFIGAGGERNFTCIGREGTTLSVEIGQALMDNSIEPPRRIDREFFYNKYNTKIFRDTGGVEYILSNENKNNLNFLLDKLDTSPVFSRLSEFAYFLATVLHETGGSYKPVVEGYWISESNRINALYNYYQNNNPAALDTIFPNGKDTSPIYYGRGYVQLTHNYNYCEFSQIFHMDFYHNPDLALDTSLAWRIAELGMSEGKFTGFKLSDFFDDNGYDFYNARQIINGHNKASLIESHAISLYDCLKFKD